MIDEMMRAGRAARGAVMAMQGKVPLEAAPRLIARCESFTSGNLRASTGPASGYTVWSYHEPIGGKTATGIWWVTSARASTTSTAHVKAVLEALRALDVRAVVTDA